MSHGSIRVTPLSDSLGADIRGVDLSTGIDDAVLAAIRRALLEYLVIFFPEQHLTPAQHTAFSARLGPLVRVPYVAPLPQHPDIVAVRKAADEANISVFGGEWHSDFSFLEKPPSLTTLYALDVPRRGGDTLWADMYRAYESLSDDLRSLLVPRRAVHSGVPYGTSAVRDPGIGTSRSMGITRRDPAADREIVHPVVRTHPESAREALFVNPVYTIRFEDMTVAESGPLLAHLYAHATRPALTYRHRWRARTLAVWDNRCTLHLAVNDYDGERRLMHRTTVGAERPIGRAATRSAAADRVSPLRRTRPE